MVDATTILIADRNSHVRMFLMREMMSYGYRVKVAGTGESVLKIAVAPDKIDLLILDPDLPGLDVGAFLATIRQKRPALPILLHTHRHEDEVYFKNGVKGFAVIEKSGDSVDRIREAVVKLLRPILTNNVTSAELPVQEGETA